MYFVAVVEPITLFVDVSQFLNRSVQVPRLLVPHCQTVIQRRPTGAPAVEPAPTVVSNCQVPVKMSVNPLWIPAVLYTQAYPLGDDVLGVPVAALLATSGLTG